MTPEYTGTHRGAPYRICIPESWNGQLVMSAQGWPATGSDLAYKSQIDIPMGNPYLLELGYAWAASGFNPKHFLPHNSHNFVPYQAAHDLAALHDHVLDTFDTPSRTYLTGLSMGGNTVLHALELFPGRYAGALVWSTAAGLFTLDYEAHTFVLGAFAAGISPDQYQGTDSLVDLTRYHIVPTLSDDSKAAALFFGLWTALSGGQRPFAKTTLAETYIDAVGIDRVPLVLEHNAFDNRDYVYPAAPGIDSQTINQGVIRIAADPAVRQADPNFSSPTGAVPVPLLMMHTTGDSGTPFSVLQDFRRAAEQTGDAERLVQRAVQAPGHGDFSGEEIERAWDDFFAWCAGGENPAGDDMLGATAEIGAAFTDPPRRH